jgi:hypothetical protein
VLADRLRITRAEARRRIDEATHLGPRRALAGEPLARKLEHTAAGQRAGLDAVLAKLAAPGMCNPADESPPWRAPRAKR